MEDEQDARDTVREPELDDFIAQGMGVTEALAAWSRAMAEYAARRVAQGRSIVH
jgi:hypothetical protein